jgi:3-oxoadipate enol-lactonase
MPIKTIDNFTMHYEDRGHGMPIVLVHGFPLDSRMWSVQIDALSNEFRVIAPDLRGFGKSISAEKFTIASLADDVHALLENIGALPCLFAGLSMGGYIALAFAKRYPRDLSGLALLDTRAEADTSKGRENRNKVIEQAKTGGAKAIADAMLPKVISESTFKNHPEIVDDVRRIIESQSPLTLQNALATMRDREDQTRNLASIAARSIVIVGEDDAVTPLASAQTMAKNLSNAKLSIIPNAGHFSPIEQPEEINRVLGQFARSPSPSGRGPG